MNTSRPVCVRLHVVNRPNVVPVFAEEGFAEGRDTTFPPATNDMRSDLLSDDSDAESEAESQARDGSPSLDTPRIKEEAEDDERPAKRRRESAGDPVSTQDPPEVRRKQVVITDFSRRTFGAMLYYLHTDSVAFAPPSSRFKHERTATETKKDYDVRLARYLNANTAWESRPVSAKSIFR